MKAPLKQYIILSLYVNICHQKYNQNRILILTLSFQQNQKSNQKWENYKTYNELKYKKNKKLWVIITITQDYTCFKITKEINSNIFTLPNFNKESCFDLLYCLDS